MQILKKTIKITQVTSQMIINPLKKLNIQAETVIKVPMKFLNQNNNK